MSREKYDRFGYPLASPKPRTTTAIRFPDDLHRRLRDAAADRDLSMNFLVIRACEDFLSRLVPADQIIYARPHGETP